MISFFKIFSASSGGQAAAANIEAGKEDPEEYDYQYYDEAKPDSPFVNPHDPTHQSPELLAGILIILSFITYIISSILYVYNTILPKP